MNTASFSREICSIVLIGSAARGDQDANSDTDLFVVCDDVDFDRLNEIKTEVHEYYASRFSNLEVSIYSLAVISDMLSCGSMFLRHVKHEGKTLFDPMNTISDLLEKLADFDGFETELRVYQSIIQQIQLYKVSNEFDLHLMQMIVRNICIMLTYHAGLPDFGRVSSFKRVKTIWPSFPLDDFVFTELTKWHVVYAKGGNAVSKLPSCVEFATIMQDIERCVLFCKEKTK